MPRTGSFLATFFLASTCIAGTFTVTATGDSGPGTLREAITNANANPGSTIAFNIAGSGVHTIRPTTPLPAITQTTTIDGYTQAGSSPNTLALASQGTNAVLTIEIDGELLPQALSSVGLRIEAGGSVVRGLVMNRCYIAAIFVPPGSGDGMQFLGNFFGTTPDGLSVAGGLGVLPQLRALQIQGGVNHKIGTAAPADRNLVSGNNGGVTYGESPGIALEVTVSDSPQASILGNIIGTDKNVQYPLANGFGIAGSSTLPIRIGGAAPGEGNVISGNGNLGISVGGGTVVTVQGNIIGTDGTGTRNLGNPGGGVILSTFHDGDQDIIGGVAPGEGNVIAFNGGRAGWYKAGISLLSGSSNRVTVRGNRIYGNVSRGFAPDYAAPAPNDPGDADTGANNLQNSPIITSVDYGPPTTVHAVFNSTPSTTFDIDFYANPVCVARPTAFPQAQDYVGTKQVTTNASGDATIDFALSSPLAAGQGVTAMATDPDGNTSENSLSILLKVDPRSGPAAGAPVTLSGQNIAAGATVSVGGEAPSGVVVTPPYTITATMPAKPPGTIHDVTVTNPGGLSGTLVNGWVADFLDVPASNAFHDDIVKLVANEVTVGVGGGLYGVDDPVKRQAMAVFLLKAEHGLCYTPPPCTPPGVFPDVPCPSAFADWIEALSAEGITGGCGNGNFCPLNTVTRAQMAPFMLKASHGNDYVPPPCQGVFADVPCPATLAFPFSDWIEQLRAEFVTAGCGNGTIYCPASPNTRGQMATFLVKALRLP